MPKRVHRRSSKSTPQTSTMARKRISSTSSKCCKIRKIDNGNYSDKDSYVEFQDETEVNQHEAKEVFATMEEIRASDVSMPLVIKKLCYKNACQTPIGNLYGYSTLNEDGKEEPFKITVVNVNKVAIDDVVCRKKFVLDGVLSLYDANPFKEGKLNGGYWNDPLIISRLLNNVESCNVTHLFLSDQTLSWKEYKKLVVSEEVKSLYFDTVYIRDKNKAHVQLVSILRKIKNIKKFGYINDQMYGNSSAVTNITFKKLNKLPCFENLKLFILKYIRHDHFDAGSFLDFIDRHSDAHFIISFDSDGLCEEQMSELATMKEMLESRATTDQLVIEA